jgi:restriction endonuclease Mrr
MVLMNFQVGACYAIEEIQQFLKVGNAGGIRVALDASGAVQRMVLLTSAREARNEKENPYHDRTEAGILVYAGAGLHGDQALGGINRRIVEQRISHFPIYGFRITGSRRKTSVKRWEFIGLLQSLRHYPDTQIDRVGQMRKVWIFEFRVCDDIREVQITKERVLMTGAFVEFPFDTEYEMRISPTSEPSQIVDKKKSPEIIECVRRKLLGLDPRKFELLIRSALEKAGFMDVSVTRYTGDGGVDVNATISNSFWPLSGLHLQVQAKRWLHTVGRREVAELRGSMDPVARGAIVTTSYFSKAAIIEAAAVGTGKDPIVLVDGYRFASVVNDYALLP